MFMRVSRQASPRWRIDALSGHAPIRRVALGLTIVTVVFMHAGHAPIQNSGKEATKGIQSGNSA
jgi:hypothetical protein